VPLRDAKLCGCSLRGKFLKGGLAGLEGKRLLPSRLAPSISIGEQGLLVASPVQRDQCQIEQHSITAEELQALLASNQEVLLVDVRQPLDLLAHIYCGKGRVK